MKLRRHFDDFMEGINQFTQQASVNIEISSLRSVCVEHGMDYYNQPDYNHSLFINSRVTLAINMGRPFCV